MFSSVDFIGHFITSLASSLSVKIPAFSSWQKPPFADCYRPIRKLLRICAIIFLKSSFFECAHYGKNRFIWACSLL